MIELNRAVAVAMAEGPERGLALIDAIDGLDGYHLLHSARADLLRRLGRAEDARAAYERALELAANPVERAFLERRLRDAARRAPVAAAGGQAPGASVAQPWAGRRRRARR